MIEQLFSDSAKERLKETTGSILEETKAEIEEQKGKETDSGRKSKDAKLAEEAEIWAGILKPILSGINAGVERYAKELSHTDEEIKVISILTGKIAPKYVDINMMKFKDEYKLGAYLIMIETQKIQNYLEARESRKESKADNNDTGKTGKRENASDNKRDNSKAAKADNNS